jgi:predicted nucleic acid-binding protein
LTNFLAYGKIGISTLINIYEIGKIAGDFMRVYRKSHSVELGDALIAGCTIKYDFKLWTFNRKHYPMLKRENLLI